MNKSVRFDNYSNLLSGLGIPSLDRTASTFYSGGRSSLGSNNRIYHGASRLWSGRSNIYELADLYTNNGLAAKIIDRPADDAFQRGVEIEGDADNVMSDEYDRLSVPAVMSDCIRWSRLYGGSAILLIAKDGGNFEDPLNLDTLDTIEELKVLDVTCINRTGRYYTDPTQINYGKLEYYNITLPGHQAFQVHETRLIPMGGEPLPNKYHYQATIPWFGRPILEGCMANIARYDQALEWSLRLLERKQQAIYNMGGLGEMVANDDTDLVVRRINMVDQVRGILNSIVVDKDDTYTVQNLGLDGLEPLINEYQTAICADTSMPEVILFGKATKGLNNTGAGDLESYYGMVQHIQQIIAYPTLEKLTSILWVQKSLKGKIPDKWEIEFNPIWSPSELEEANTENIEAQANSSKVTTLISLMDNGILAPEEVRKIVINEIYQEYDFADTLPTTGNDVTYSQMVQLQNQVAGGGNSNQPQNNPGNNPSNNRSVSN